MRQLNEFPIFVRYNKAIGMINKIRSKKEDFISSIVNSRNPFGITSSERGRKSSNKNSLTLYSSEGVGYIDGAVTQGKHLVDKYKVMISKVTSEHAGEPDKNGQMKIISKIQVLKPSEVCTDSYLIAGGFSNNLQATNLCNYLKSKFARFLLLQAVSSINLSKDKFNFIPLQNFDEAWTDEKLYKKYAITKDEIAFIESLIRPMD